MQLNATDDGQKSVTFGVDEIASLLDSKVKCVLVQCCNCWEEIIGELIICKMTPNVGQMFRTALYRDVL